MVNCLRFLLEQRWLRSVCLAVTLVLCLSSTAFALESEENLPHVDRWVNGSAVSADGVYLGDTWAVDDTGISNKRYVLLDQTCVEVLRIASYPDGVKGDDTEPCEKKTLTASLTLPDGMTGGVIVTIENDAAMYYLSFEEADGYQVTLDVYPGVYKITDVEVSSDVRGDYAISRYSQLEIASDITVPFEVIPAAAEDADQQETEHGSTDASELETEGDASDETDAGSNSNEDADDVDDGADGGSDGNEDVGGSNQDGDDDKLLGSTIRMVGTMAVLLGVYGFIRFKSELALKRKR